MDMTDAISQKVTSATPVRKPLQKAIASVSSPAMGLAWYISNEHYYPEALKKVVSKLKLRFSIGRTGNDDTGGNRFLYRGTMKQDNSGYNIGFSNSGALAEQAMELPKPV